MERLRGWLVVLGLACIALGAVLLYAAAGLGHALTVGAGAALALVVGGILYVRFWHPKDEHQPNASNEAAPPTTHAVALAGPDSGGRLP